MRTHDRITAGLQKMIATALCGLCLCAFLVGAQEEPTTEPSRDVLGLAASLESVESNYDGSFIVTFTLLTANLGQRPLASLQLASSLQEAFPEPASVEIVDIHSDQLTLAEAFDGIEFVELLDGSDNLDAGESRSLTLVLRVTPGQPESEYAFSAKAQAKTLEGGEIVDLSQDGTLWDPDLDDDPTNNDLPTRVFLSTVAIIGVAKNLDSVSDAVHGERIVIYTMTVKNYGAVTVREIQIRDDLRAAFPAPADVRVVRIRSTDFVTNPAYDGLLDPFLLEGVDRLNPGEQGSVTLEIGVTTHASGFWFRNHVFATAHGLGESTASDLSQDGLDPDPDGDGNPTPDQDPTEVFLAETEMGGFFETTMVFSPDPFSIEIDAITLNTFFAVNGFKAQLDAKLTQTTFDQLSVSVALPLWPTPLNSTLVFNPSLLTFVSWQTSTSFELAGIEISDTLFVTTPQSSSYNLFEASGNAGDLSLRAGAKFGICPFEFWEASVCADWTWPNCSIPISACVAFTDAVGFDAITVSASGIPVFTDVFSFDGTLDVSLEYSTEEKTISPNLTVQPDWIVCPEITLLGEVGLPAGTLGIESFSIYGITVEAQVGPVTFFLGDSFVDSKNSAATGKSEYFEVIGLETPLASCCGTPGSFTLATYFERPPAPSGGLLGIGLIEAELESQFGEHVSFSLLAQYRPVAPVWGFTASMRVLW